MQVRPNRCRFGPWVRKIPWRRARQPTPIFLPGECHGQRSLAGYCPWGHKESDMTEQLTFSFLSKAVFYEMKSINYIIIFYSFFKKLFKLGLFSCFVQSAKQKETGFLFSQRRLSEPQFLNTEIFNSNFSVTDQSI